MNIKTKVSLIFLILIIIYSIVNYGIQHIIIYPSFLALENDESIKNLKRTELALQREIIHLDLLCVDWASWDDTYDFIDSRSEDYINANLTTSSFEINKVNVIYFINLKGTVIWGNIDVPGSKKNIYIKHFTQNSFPENHPLISYNTKNKLLKNVKITGIYMTNIGPMLVSSRPIINGKFEGPIRGYLIFGRFLDKKIVQTLIEQTQVNFQIFPVIDGTIDKTVKKIFGSITSKNQYIVNVRNNKFIDSYTKLNDINGEPAFLIKSTSLRNISKKGYSTIQYATFSILAAGTIILILILLLLLFTILDPISKFTKLLIQIGKTGDLSGSVFIQRKDEIGILSNEFSRMLGHLKKSHDELEKKIDERTVELTIINRKLKQEIIDRQKAEKEARISEAKLANARRMESLGLMAGGIAHDLNNILSGIVSYPDLILTNLSEDHKSIDHIKMIKESGQRAADVVADLLTVARGITNIKDVVNLNSIVREHIFSPEHKKIEAIYPIISLTTKLDSRTLNLICSSVHIKKCLLNLILNAYESIQDRGQIIISTLTCYLDKPLKGYENVNKGEYAILSVSDNGSGISTKDVERIFEPFYTKKVIGRSGTGLGLAIVWNTVKSHKGYINVESSKAGTEFKLFFPMTGNKVNQVQKQNSLSDYLGNGEKILIVDDEEMQRELASAILNRLGYSTKSVSSGEAAISYLEEHSADLIVLDMIMPKGMNGLETYKKIKTINPNLKAIIASGFAETDDEKAINDLGVVPYIKKPYTIRKIGAAIKNELER